MSFSYVVFLLFGIRNGSCLVLSLWSEFLCPLLTTLPSTLGPCRLVEGECIAGWRTTALDPLS